MNKVIDGIRTHSRNEAVTLPVSLHTRSPTFTASYHFTVPAIRGLSAEIPSQLENTLRSVDMVVMIQGAQIRNKSACAKIVCLNHAVVV